MRMPRLARYFVCVAVAAAMTIASAGTGAGAAGDRGPVSGGSGGIGFPQTGGGGVFRNSGGMAPQFTRPICGKALGRCTKVYTPDGTCFRYQNANTGQIGVTYFLNQGPPFNQLCGDLVRRANDERRVWADAGPRQVRLLPDGTSDRAGLAGLPTLAVVPIEDLPGGRNDTVSDARDATEYLKEARVDLTLMSDAKLRDLRPRWEEFFGASKGSLNGKYLCADTSDNENFGAADPGPVFDAGDPADEFVPFEFVAKARAGGSKLKAFGLHRPRGDEIATLRAAGIDPETVRVASLDFERAGTYDITLQTCWLGSGTEVSIDGSVNRPFTDVPLLYSQVVAPGGYVVQERRSVYTR